MPTHECIPYEWCECFEFYRFIDKLQGELECKCKGLALVRVPQRLPVNMQRLIVTSAGIPMLRYTGLKMYGRFLQDV